MSYNGFKRKFGNTPGNVDIKGFMLISVKWVNDDYKCNCYTAKRNNDEKRRLKR